MDYLVLAYYIFVPIADPALEVKNHHLFFKGRDATARIYISTEGINGQMSAKKEDAEAYMQWLHSDPRFASVAFKAHPHSENVFPRCTIKVRKHLVALGEEANPEEAGEHLSPKQWRQMLEADPDALVLDIRNEYEWKIGRFKRAEQPTLEQFRHFPKYADELKERMDPEKTRVMMSCTGGIRCELYSALLKKRGFKNVYQLEGGIIGYGLHEGSEHWEGKLFVFDERLAVNIDGQERPPISQCKHCEDPCDTYYNCAHMQCNDLFLCCEKCLAPHKGCCTQKCQESPRVRPLNPKRGNKPFLRKHLCSLEEEKS